MQQDEPTPPLNADAAVELPQEVTRVPLWVKGIVVTGAVLFAVQMSGFMGSLSDAVQKSRAEKAYDDARYAQAIDSYKALHSRYPADKNLIKRLGFSYYRAGLYVEAIDMFNELAGKEMPQREIDEINAAVSDMAARLNLKTR